MRIGTPKRRTSVVQEEAGDLGETCPLGAACLVIQDMLALKYSLQLDEADFLTKAKARCDASDRASPALLAAALNTEPALRVKDEANDRLLQLELKVTTVTSFAELRAYVRRWHGTACAVAAVAERGTRKPQVVAVYREAYGETESLVAKTRSRVYGGFAPLLDFRQDGFRGAVLLEPVVARVLKYESQPNMMLDIQVPAESAEFRRAMTGTDFVEEDVATRACALLAELATQVPGDDVYLRPGGAEAGCAFCARLMSCHLANRPLQVAACRALAGLLPGVAPDAAEGQAAVELLAAAMRRHSQCPDVLEAACWALAGSMAMRPDLQAVASTNGAAEEVVASMRRFQGPGSEELQVWACGALASLSASNPTLQATIAASRGVDSVLLAMRLQPDHVRLQHMACGALSNLAANSFNNQAAIATSGGVNAVLQAMQLHPDEPTVLQSAVAALWCLVKNNTEYQQIVTRSGGVEFIVDAVQRHPHDAKLKSLAAGALQLLVPGLGEALAATSAAAAGEAWPETPGAEEAAAGAAAAAPRPVQVAAPAALHSARSEGGASTAVHAVSAWALDTADDDDDEDDESGQSPALPQPPGMTARGVRRAPLVKPASGGGEPANGSRLSTVSFA